MWNDQTAATIFGHRHVTVCQLAKLKWLHTKYGDWSCAELRLHELQELWSFTLLSIHADLENMPCATELATIRIAVCVRLLKWAFESFQAYCSGLHPTLSWKRLGSANSMAPWKKKALNTVFHVHDSWEETSPFQNVPRLFAPPGPVVCKVCFCQTLSLRLEQNHLWHFIPPGSEAESLLGLHWSLYSGQLLFWNCQVLLRSLQQALHSSPKSIWTELSLH